MTKEPIQIVNDHILGAGPEVDTVIVLKHGERGPGNAYHHYVVIPSSPDGQEAKIHFQEGPVSEVGVNGINQEALLAVVIDRLRDFQEGPGRCRENALALIKLEEAMHWLHSRTRDRLNRGVEGTSEE